MMGDGFIVLFYINYLPPCTAVNVIFLIQNKEFKKIIINVFLLLLCSENVLRSEWLLMATNKLDRTPSCLVILFFSVQLKVL